MTATTESNPFTPGAGLSPPYLAGRDEEQSQIGELLAATQRGGGGAPDLVLFGPRGTGKTVMLTWIKEQIRKKSRSDSPFRHKELDAGELPDSQRDIVQELLDVRIDIGRPDKVEGEAGMGPVRGRGSWSLEQTNTSMYEVLVAECRTRPLVIVMDESHIVSPQGCGALLRLSQKLKTDGACVLTVLAGTPALIDVLAAADATFVERSHVISLGLLDPASSRTAIEVPMRPGGIAADKAVLEAATKDSQGYPWFLQLWGKALWQSSTESKRRELVREDAERAREKIDRQRRGMYEFRFGKWDRSFKSWLAKVLFHVDLAGRITPAALDSAIDKVVRELALQSMDRDNIRSEILASDILWSPWGSSTLTPGIPSVVNYILESEGWRDPPRRNTPGASIPDDRAGF